MSDDLLREWREAGLWDSQGSFTIDTMQALEKLKVFTLEEPRRYILSLVSWAVAAGARAIEVHAWAGSLEVVVPGVSLSQRDLAELFAEEGLAGVASRELAIATLTASGISRARVLLCGQDTRLCLDSNGLTVEPIAGDQTRWRLEEPRSVLGWVGRVLGDQGLEVPLLRELCAHCEVPITVNGAPLYRPLQLPRIRKAIQLDFVTPTAFGPPLPLEPEVVAPGIIDVRPSPGAFSAIVALSSSPILRTNALYLVRGVSFEMPPFELEGINFAVVVNAPNLRKDLSGRGLVDDQHLRDIGAHLRQLCQELQEWSARESRPGP